MTRAVPPAGSQRGPTGGSNEFRPAIELADGLWLAAVLALGVAALLGFQLHAQEVTGGGVPLDDAWIHFQFARNLAGGGGFAFNPAEPTAGSTAPLWTLLLAAAYAVGGAFPAAGQLMSAGSFLLALAATYALAKALTQRRWAGALAAAVTAVNGRFIWAGLSALETPLFAALSLLAVVSTLRRRHSDCFPLISAALFALATLARPEGLLLFGLALADHAFRQRGMTRGAPMRCRPDRCDAPSSCAAPHERMLASYASHDGSAHGRQRSPAGDQLRDKALAHPMTRVDSPIDGGSGLRPGAPSAERGWEGRQEAPPSGVGCSRASAPPEPTSPQRAGLRPAVRSSLRRQISRAASSTSAGPDQLHTGSTFGPSDANPPPSACGQTEQPRSGPNGPSCEKKKKGSPLSQSAGPPGEWKSRKPPGAILHPARLLQLLPAAALYLLLILPYVIFSLRTAGAPFPNTFSAKAALRLVPDLDVLSLAARYLILDNPLLLPFFVLGLGALFLGPARVVPAWAAALPLAYGFLGAALYQHGRYLIPLIPFNAVVSVIGLEEARRLAARRGHRLPHLRAPLAALAAILVLAGTAWRLPTMARLYAQDIQNINQMHVAAGRWVEQNTPDDALLALNDIGAITYVSQRPIVDLAGLVTPDVVPILRSPHRTERLLHFMADRSVDYVIIFPSWFPGLAARDDVLKQVHQITPAQRTIAGGQTMIIYRTDWSTLSP